MKHYGLIGKTLGHSFSQKHFSRKFADEGIDADYALCEVATPESLPAVLANDDWNGLNVTIPYKTAIIPYLDALDAEAEKIGAVNTVKFERRGGHRRTVGYNTDAIGFEQSLRPLLAPYHDKALVLGTGGASKAVTFVLDKLGIEWIYVSREAGPRRLDYAETDAQTVAAHRLIVNATPLGMFPETDGYPDIPYHALTSRHLLFDLVYNPAQTLFLAYGEKYGATTKNGAEMLRLQAEAAYRIWTSGKLIRVLPAKPRFCSKLSSAECLRNGFYL